jgi:hypothetical protein
MFPNFEPEKIRRFLQLLIDREWMYSDQRERYIFLPVFRPAAFQTTESEDLLEMAHA